MKGRLTYGNITMYSCMIGKIATGAWWTRQNILNLSCYNKIQGVTTYVRWLCHMLLQTERLKQI